MNSEEQIAECKKEINRLRAVVREQEDVIGSFAELKTKIKLEVTRCNGLNSLNGCHNPECFTRIGKIKLDAEDAQTIVQAINTGFVQASIENGDLVLNCRTEPDCDCWAGCKGGCNEK